MSGYETLAIGISLCAVIVAAVSFGMNRRTRKQLLEHRSTRNEPSAAERAKAAITVELVYYGSRSGYFMIQNCGLAEALNICLDINPPVGTITAFAPGYDGILPIEKLDPGKRVSLLAVPMDEPRAPFFGRWIWENPDGSSDQMDQLVDIRWVGSGE
ncbi:MAG: hypothetical protein SVM79_02970 [Chloroflexota bacterium]|nr:hypothetical protein [Chloroflexota bacterium]